MGLLSHSGIWLHTNRVPKAKEAYKIFRLLMTCLLCIGIEFH